MATLTQVISPPSAAGSARADSLAGASAKGSDSRGEFAQLMSGAIEAQASAQSPSSHPGAGDVRTSTPPNNASGTQNLTDTQAALNQLQTKINTLLAQNPPLTSSVQHSLKALLQQLASITATLAGSADPMAQAVLGAKTLSDLQKKLDQLQTLLSQADEAGSSWGAQLQAMALNLAQGLNPTASCGVGLTGAAQAGMHSPHEGLNQASMALSANKPGLTAQNNSTGAIHPAEGSMATGANASLAQGSATAAQLMAAHMANGAGNGAANSTGNGVGSTQSLNNLSLVNQNLSHLLSDGFNSIKPNLNHSAPLTISQPATDLTSNLISGLPTALPAAGFGSIATHSVFATLPNALDLNQAKMPSDLGQNIQWMLGKNISRATLDINPANLGPLKISIDQQHDQIQIQIMAAHHLTRDALDQAIPRLREWLQEAGLNHAEVTIGSFDAQSGQNPFLNQNSGQSSGFGQAASHHAPGTAPGTVPTLEADNAKAVDGAVQKLTSVWRLDTFV